MKLKIASFYADALEIIVILNHYPFCLPIIYPKQNMESFPLKNHEQDPQCCVGLLFDMSKGIEQMIGVAFLVSSNFILTTAQNVYSRKHNSQFQSLVFSHQNKMYKVISCRYSQSYKTCLSKDSIKPNYALLKIQTSIHLPSYIELGVDYVDCKQDIFLIGYKKIGQNLNDYQKSVFISDSHKVYERSLQHQLSLLDRNCGAPILIKRNHKYIAIAINKGQSVGNKCNQGALISINAFYDIICWEKQMTSSIKFHQVTKDIAQQTSRHVQQILKAMNKKWKIVFQDLQEYKQKRHRLQEIDDGENNGKKKQKKIMQVTRKYTADIIQYLQKLPSEEKQDVTSLVLKQTVLPLL